MKKYNLTGLSDDEKKYLTQQLGDYRTKRAAKEKINQFYQDTIAAYGFDHLGRFESFTEMGLERTIWLILDESKDQDRDVEYKKGDRITLLDASGAKIRKPITLDKNSIWGDYHEMCDLLKIKPDLNNSKYYVGLTRSKKKKHKK
ncbi:MAG: hypothetical protein AABW48_02260 [Nanoarchaeota archaeon]|mgnify:FL=1